MDLQIFPQSLSGTVTPPTSKSYAHRAILCAALAGMDSQSGSRPESVLEYVPDSQDIRATLQAVQALGAHTEKQSDGLWRIGAITNPKQTAQIDCAESGSTLRFLLPIALVFGGTFHFIGGGNLGNRPLDTFSQIFSQNGIQVQNRSSGGNLDLYVQGQLKSGCYTLDGHVSSQFITGMLYALSVCDGPSTLSVGSEMVSTGYVDITLDVLRAFGAEVVQTSAGVYQIHGGRPFRAMRYRVEGDWSQAAFFEVANRLGSCIRIEGMAAQSLQPDRAIVPYLDRLFSAPAEETLVFDAQNCPDMIPVFSVACALRPGKTVIDHAQRLRIKECDRLHATAEELLRLGARVQEKSDQLLFDGVEEFAGGCDVFCYNDHRMAMSLAIAATRCRQPIVLRGCECVQKSYPHFFEDYKSLGGKIQ